MEYKVKPLAAVWILVLTSFFIVSVQSTSAQADTVPRHFTDDLLDHLVGNWKVYSTAHGFKSTGRLDAAWVLNHQFMHVHLKSDEIIPWWQVQMEYDEYIGFNHNRQQYTIHGMSIEGDYDPTDGVATGSRNGNEFKTVAVANKDTSVVQRMVWFPDRHEWIVKSNMMVGEKKKRFSWRCDW